MKSTISTDSSGSNGTGDAARRFPAVLEDVASTTTHTESSESAGDRLYLLRLSCTGEESTISMSGSSSSSISHAMSLLPEELPCAEEERSVDESISIRHGEPIKLTRGTVRVGVDDKEIFNSGWTFRTRLSR